MRRRRLRGQAAEPAAGAGRSRSVHKAAGRSLLAFGLGAEPRTARPPSDAGGGGGSGPGVAEAGPADDVYRAALFAAIFAEAALVGMLPVIGGPKMAGEGMVGRTEVRVAPGQSPADARPLTPLQAGQQAPP